MPVGDRRVEVWFAEDGNISFRKAGSKSRLASSKEMTPDGQHLFVASSPAAPYSFRSVRIDVELPSEGDKVKLTVEFGDQFALRWTGAKSELSDAEGEHCPIIRSRAKWACIKAPILTVISGEARLARAPTKKK